METLFKHVEGKAKPASSINKEIPKQLNNIIMKAMARNADDRYQDVDDLAR
ncbi:MAG: hypothetical protein GWO08_16000, partial [Gammaproteobacteria bacterium]|nr:hypothetical protein [Gammaproteobacteria bacterium]NIR95101.1 hypothetical protein [Gammaproteobacteria bacterium]NIW45191.1 hypothetical protein [Gammaproteobacteria bacterium]